MRSDEVARLLADSGCLLLDFDGPVCSIFAAYQATAIAAELRRMLPHDSAGDLLGGVSETLDPLEVLRWASANAPAAVCVIEDALRAAELQAAAGAAPTAYAGEVMAAAKRAHRPVAIVSNNSAPAIHGYLAAHRLDQYVTAVIGRRRYQPELMKPDPYSVLMALERLGCEPSRALLIGDSLADITAAHEAGVRVIGLANRLGKKDEFTAAGADVIVPDMADIAVALSKVERIGDASQGR